MQILAKSNIYFRNKVSANYLGNPHIWILLVLILAITSSYYLDFIYIKDNLDWLWLYRVIEYRFHANGILLYIPLIYAAIVFGWAGITVSWILAMALVLPQIIYLSFDLNSLFYNIVLLTAPVLVFFLIVFLFKWVERETKIFADREIERQAYMEKILKAQEDERKRIARELHDDSIQNLLAIANRLEALIQKEGNSPETQLTRQLEISRDTVFQVSQDLRRLSMDLRPSVLDDIGLVEAVRSLVDNFNNNSIKAKLAVSGESLKLSSETEVIVYRFIQEALNNCKHHSEATEIDVELNLDSDIIRIRVIDNGKGFYLPRPISKLSTENKFGIIGMQERAHMLDGIFDINSKPGQGTSVSLEFKIIN
jgi:signal transduction histidine kinase